MGTCRVLSNLLLVAALLMLAAADPHVMDRRMANGTMWAVQLTQDALKGRDLAEMLQEIADEHGCRVIGPVGNLKDYFLLEHDSSHRNKRSIENVGAALQDHPAIDWAEEQIPKRHEKRATINDPLFGSQWHLHNSAGVDMNVYPAWSHGVSGLTVGISIVDDGLDWAHRDFGEYRYLREASHDWNSGDSDPSPYAHDDTHGTSCGGIAFGGMNDGACGVGISYRASFSGQRLISGDTTDALEAAGLTYRTDLNHIYSMSWGPTDDGARKEGPGRLTREALVEAITNGRNGKGSIFVWAGGNGGSIDNVNNDGYASSIYTIAVASVDGNGRKASYSEEGSSLLVSATSSPPGIATTAIRNGCTLRFGGTSAAAPMIAGVVGLMLEANPNLTWRDVQDILARTARKNDPENQSWAVNGAGLHVNHKYGFGLADTGKAVEMAHSRGVDEEHPLLPPPITPLIIEWEPEVSPTIGDNDRVGIKGTISVNSSFTVEHVTVGMFARHPRRGDLRIVLTSPSGTTSVLAVPGNDAHPNYTGWPFTSTFNWGEDSLGDWTLTVSDEMANNQGVWQGFVLTLYGHGLAQG